MRKLITIVLLLGSHALHAQSDTTARSVGGTVKSGKDGALLPFVTVKVKGSNRGTITDANGNFKLLVKPTDTLILTAIGFRKLESPAGKLALLSLTLPEDARTFNEVMVVGYGNERKRNITGAISTISGKEITKSSALSFDNAIIGKAAGVNIISSSGIPGSATAITIRGLSTLNPDGSQPLIVIDGIPVYGSGRELNSRNFNASTSAPGTIGGASVSDSYTPPQAFESNPLAALNPADIESIEILKDAYATAIYGSRAAAGVILVTTKKGKKGSQAFNVRSVTGAIQPIGKYKLLNGAEYNDIYTRYYRQLGTNEVFNGQDNTDWVDAITRTAISQQVDASLAAGSEKAQYYISGSYTSQPSYIINNDYKRYSGRMNLSYQASKAIQVGVNMSMSYTENSAMNAAAIYRSALQKAPNLPIYNADGSYAYGKGANPLGDPDANPVAEALRNKNELKNSEALGNAYLQYKPIDWLTLRTEFGTQLSNGDAYSRRVKRPSGYGDDAVQTTTQYRKIVTNNTASFLKMINKHYINAVAGQSFEKSTETNTGIGGYGFFNDEILSIAAARNRYIKGALKQQWALTSYFARLNYEFDNKYLAGVTYRLDGSSRFSRNRRYIGFPSFSAGWRLSEESFLKEKKWLDDLKLRGSIGFTGNNNSSSYYGSQGQYQLNSDNLSYAGTPILQMQQPDNPNLKWERTRSVDLGLDMSLLDNTVNITLDYYHRRVKDMILSSAIPRYQGWSVQQQNIGDMMNEGLELAVRAELLRRKHFSWSTNFNISWNRNKILKLNFVGEEVGLANEAYKYLKEGQAAGQFFLYDWQGVDGMSGNPAWGDGKGNTTFVPPASLFSTVEDVNAFRKSYGTALPDFYGGMGHTFTYRNWELDAFFSFSVGNKMINGARAALLTYTMSDAPNLSSEILNYWLVPGHETDIPKLVNRSVTTSVGSSNIRDYTTSRTSSRFLEDASYLRLRSIRLAYQLPVAKLKVLRSLELFIAGTNLFTLTGYSGIDPEVSAFGSSALQAGYDELTMPQNKMYQFGINIGL
ncbi:SusC/RagA family TonB-linked outer membrane protein [Chitinophaga sp. SYP-B3965]|uniref:SusC/RagA family TonB-linked outer membrane protein n=1 Tax=Chitinophaga sp. SYP-B3965 TaxID=2663120 RepID=UPI00129A007B|nr:TonB-dependent receptor [Chitinophaga sp. SYP-B3965]MRG43794.1 SusC/RagA family TonB-linked outer membrane protein [Chitinophaga sp. SYP-B3965]